MGIWEPGLFISHLRYLFVMKEYVERHGTHGQ